mmetsp:Transcript_87315/g.282701  ORF Transcript_87315/g.282701 Transcript_87315/m.282701 type:complete len:258 (-) Transcript_87315:250-1023(-)
MLALGVHKRSFALHGLHELPPSLRAIEAVRGLRKDELGQRPRDLLGSPALSPPEAAKVALLRAAAPLLGLWGLLLQPALRPLLCTQVFAPLVVGLWLIASAIAMPDTVPVERRRPTLPGLLGWERGRLLLLVHLEKLPIVLVARVVPDTLARPEVEVEDLAVGRAARPPITGQGCLQACLGNPEKIGVCVRVHPQPLSEFVNLVFCRHEPLVQVLLQHLDLPTGSQERWLLGAKSHELQCGAVGEAGLGNPLTIPEG